jgi:hypothetical protein
LDAAAKTSRDLSPVALKQRKRFILVDREHGNVLGDTGFD